MVSLDELLSLRLGMLVAFPECRTDERAIAHQRERLAGFLAGAEAVDVLRTGDRARAAVVFGAPISGMLGMPTRPGGVFCVPEDREAQEWAAEKLVEARDRLDSSFVTILSPSLPQVLASVEGRGFSVQALLLHGNPQVAFDRLGGDRELGARERRLRDDHGLETSRLRTAEQIERLVELRRAFFTSNPQVSPINTDLSIDEELQSQIDAFVRRTLQDGAREDVATQFVVSRSEEVVGGFGVVQSEDSPLWGRCAGVEVFLTPAVQGRGLGVLLYLVVLRRMLELGVRTFHGTTANPAVVHLSRKMGRSLRGWKVVRGHYDERPAHLDYPLEL